MKIGLQLVYIIRDEHNNLWIAIGSSYMYPFVDYLLQLEKKNVVDPKEQANLSSTQVSTNPPNNNGDPQMCC